MKIDLTAVKDLGARPRVHGNGFIQLDIGGDRRLHIWGHRDLPRQRVDTGIHDHTFDFMSSCIVGRVVNVPYTINEAGPHTHKVYEPKPRDGEDTSLHNTEWLVRPTPREISLIPEDSEYLFRAFHFHETFSDRPSATVMFKIRKYQGSRARVLVPVGHEPDNDFNRNNFPDAMLWGIIHEVLGY